MAAKEARLIMKLVDGVSGPAKAIVGSLGRVNAATKTLVSMGLAPARAMTDLGRGMRRHATDATVMSAAVTAGFTEAAKAVYDYEKEGNRMQAFGLLNDGQRKHLEDEAKRLNKFFPQTNKGILEAASELFRAGLTYEQALGALEGSLQLSLAGDIDTQSAADIATNIMYAMKMPMSTMEEVQASLSKINDLLAYGAAESNTDIKLMSDTFRYVAPLAAVAGMSIEEVTGLTMELAKAGIKGAEAGVALRSGLVRMAKPTKPMIAAFNRLNINMKDFVQYKQKIEASDITASLMADGYDLSKYGQDIQAILDDKSLSMAPQRMLARLADLVVGTIGDESVREKITDTLQDAILAGGQKVDLVKLLRVLKEKGATITDISQIFDVRMGSRLAAILYNDLDAVTDKVKKEYRGTAAEMAKSMTKGIVGAWLEVTAAIENFFISLAESGVMETVANAMERFTSGINDLAGSDPKLLKFGTYAALALAALAPLGFAASGIAASLALMVNPLTWVVGGLAYLGAINFDSIVRWLHAFGRIFTDNLSPQVLDAFGAAAQRLKGWFSDLVSAGADGEAWARTAKNWAEASAAAVNQFYDVATKVMSSGFVKGFMDGFGTALDNMAWAAQKLADAMGSFGVNAQPFINFLNSEAGTSIGKFFGEISGYGLGLAAAAVGVGLMASAIGALASALLTLSGARVGLAVLGGLAGMLGFGGKAGAGAGLGAGATAGGGLLAGLTKLGIAGAGIAGLSYLISKFGSQVKVREPGKNTPGDYFLRFRKYNLDRANGTDGGTVPTPTDAPIPTKADRSVLHPQVLADMAKPPVSVEEAERRLNDFGTKADATGQKAKDALSITANPIIDSSSLDAFLAKIARGVSAMTSLGAGAGLPSLNYTADHADSGARAMGARAAGGPIRRGLTYEINERGRETVTMGTNGYVTPAHRVGTGGGAGPLIGELHLHGGDSKEILSKLGQTIRHALGRSADTAIDGRTSY